MKKLLQFLFFLVTVLISTNLFSQNVMLNVLTQNSGIVKKNEIIFFEVTINNTNGFKSIPPYKLRPQISFPLSLVEIPETGHVLPKGWTIISNTKGVVVLSNGSDLIPETEGRTILIAMKGKAVGGPSTIMANLSFSTGIAPGFAVGSAPAGDNPADNVSTSTIRVEK